MTVTNDTTPLPPLPNTAPTGRPIDLTKGVFSDVEDEAAEKRCKWDRCGRVIKGRHPSAEYCSDDHKESAYRERKNGGRAPATAASSSRAPKGTAPPVGSAVWATLGYLAQISIAEPIGPPVGRVMQFQAGDAGPRLERLSGRVIKLLPFLQMAKGKSELAGDVASLIGPPLITAAIASGRLPRMVAEPVFVSMMRPLIADALEKSKQQSATMIEMTEAEQEVIDTTRDFVAAIFGWAPADEEAMQ